MSARKYEYTIIVAGSVWTRGRWTEAKAKRELAAAERCQGGALLYRRETTFDPRRYAAGIWEDPTYTHSDTTAGIAFYHARRLEALARARANAGEGSNSAIDRAVKRREKAWMAL